MVNLIINNGSTSFRFTIFYDNERVFDGKIENINSGNSYYQVIGENINDKKCFEINNIEEAFCLMNTLLLHYSIILSKEDIDTIGFRIVSGGNIFNDTSIINDKIDKIKRLKEFMPLHYKSLIKSISLCKNYYDSILVGVFDNTFHNTIPIENFLYGIPLEFYEKYGIRKYGYHGISYSSIVNKYKEENEDKEMNSIICHLGGGSSICSIKNGKSYDTTMGFSPNSGLIMSSRCGDIDSSIIFYLINLGFDINEIEQTLNSKSGYYGYVGFQDAKKLVDEANRGNKNAILLRNIINNNFKKNLLSMMSTNKPNEIIITGGMGLKNKEQREMLFGSLEDFNIKIDKEKNNKLFDEDGIISKKDSIPIMVMKNDEEKEINNECLKVLARRVIQ